LLVVERPVAAPEPGRAGCAFSLGIWFADKRKGQEPLKRAWPFSQPGGAVRRCRPL